RQLWLRGQRPDVDAFLERRGPLPAEQIVAMLTVDQLLRWQCGEKIPVEEYLERHPGLGLEPEYHCDLAYGEFLLRDECCERVDIDAYRQRVAECGELLQVQVDLSRAMQATPATKPPPERTTAPPDAPRPAQLALARDAAPLQLDCEIRALLRARLIVI